MSDKPDFIVDPSGDVQDVRGQKSSHVSHTTPSSQTKGSKKSYPDRYPKSDRPATREKGDSGGAVLIPVGLIISLILFIINFVSRVGGPRNIDDQKINEASSGRNSYSAIAISELERGLDFYAEGDYDSAISCFDSAITADSKMPEAYNDRGLAYYAKGDTEKAISDFNQTIQIMDDYAPPYNNRAIVYSYLGNLDRAFTDLNKAIELEHRFGKAYYNRGLYYLEKGEYDNAIADFSKAIELASEFPAKILPKIETMEIPTVSPLLEEFMPWNPFSNSKEELLNMQISANSPEAYQNRAIAYHLKGDDELAVTDLDQAVQLGLDVEIAENLKAFFTAPPLEWTPFPSMDGETEQTWYLANETFGLQIGNLSVVPIDHLEGLYNEFNYPTISNDGQYVAFQSNTSDLVENDTNGKSDIFVHDIQQGTTKRISIASDETESNGHSDNPIISGDGRFVAFSSEADNLVANDTNGRSDIFVHDRVSGQTARVSIASDGNQANGHNLNSISISEDGRYIVFQSIADNLVLDDTNGMWDIFVHDMQNGITTRVSVASDGTQANGDSFVFIRSISADGRYITFSSSASNLASNDTNNLSDAFVHDTLTGITTMASISSDGMQGNSGSSNPTISADGRYIAFWSLSSNLFPNDTNNIGDIFVHDRETNITKRISISSEGDQSVSENYYPIISGDGWYVVFSSDSDNLVPGDTNNSPDIFVRDLNAGSTYRICTASDGTQGNEPSYGGFISSDGKYIVFYSWADNLVPYDQNQSMDIFVFTRNY